MAILGSIRKRTGLLLIVIVLGLGLFLLQDALFNSPQLFGDDPDKIGEIAGNDVYREDFNQEMSFLETGYSLRNEGKSPGERERDMFRRQAWESLIFENAWKKQFEELGITLTKGSQQSEEYDMFRGVTIDEGFKQQFSDPETKEIDHEGIQQYFQQLKSLQERQPQNQQQAQQAAQFQAQYRIYKKSVTKQRLRNKYTSLLEKTNYVTTAEAKRQYKGSNTKLEFDYLYIPFKSIEDSAVEYSNAELKDYFNSNKKKYKQDEASRSIKYLTFDIKPNGRDSSNAYTSINNIIKDLKATKRDSALVKSYGDQGELRDYTYNRLPSNLKQDSAALRKDTVVGPFFERDKYKAYKVRDIFQDRTYKAAASHILINTQQVSDSATMVAKQQLADSLLNVAKSGADFAMLAEKFSEGPTKSKGGDLGEISPGQMVPEFDEVVFGATKKGVINKVVKTQFGFHIINIDKVKYTESIEDKYSIASVSQPIMAGRETRDSIYNLAARYLSGVSDLKSLEKKAEKDSTKELQSSNNLKPGSKSLGKVNNARAIIQWAFMDGDVGDLYDGVEETPDAFVIAAVSGKSEAGDANFQIVKEDVKKEVLNEKKADILFSEFNSLEGDLATRHEKLIEKNGRGYSYKDKVKGITMDEKSLSGNVGNEPMLIGAAFGLKPDTWSKAMKGENGIFVVQMFKRDEADEPTAAEIDKQKEALRKSVQQAVTRNISNAIKALSEIVDQRYKMY